MPRENIIMLSVSPVYARPILSGAKSVELRRRAPRIADGTRAWLYSTLPVGEIVALLEIETVVEAPISELWERYGDRASISKTAFDRYFAGLISGAALIIGDVQALKQPISLQEMRQHGAFHPPQFYRRVRQDAAGQRLASSELYPPVRLVA